MATVIQLCIMHLYICMEIDRKKLVNFVVHPWRVENYRNFFIKYTSSRSSSIYFFILEYEYEYWPPEYEYEYRQSRTRVRVLRVFRPPLEQIITFSFLSVKKNASEPPKVIISVAKYGRHLSTKSIRCFVSFCKMSAFFLSFFLSFLFIVCPSVWWKWKSTYCICYLSSISLARERRRNE